jgi:phosphatidylinositol alpha 1,6-mannosyltransferase
MRPLRLALFSDSHYEANGVARTTNALERYAAERGKPMLSVHAGSVTRTVHDGPIVRLELGRWMATSFGLEHDLRFDFAMWRHVGRVEAALRRFAPDVLHFTGPSDVGQLGAYLGYRLKIPMVGSWHTNLHEYASRRLRLRWASDTARRRARTWIEQSSLRACLQFYRIAQVILAPNDELLQMLTDRLGKPTFLMSRGVDTELFNPAKRERTDSVLNIGYVGRLSKEKSVRVLAEVEQALIRAGHTNIRFTIVGEGGERQWLTRHMRCATFTGVLRGEALAAAYANMDLFVFPSETETVGNVGLEAMASGVPIVAMARGGPRFVTKSRQSALLARDHRELVYVVQALVNSPLHRGAMRAAARAEAFEKSWHLIFDEVYRAYAFAVSLAERQARPVEDRLWGKADA